MANRRMVGKNVIYTDAFMSMPISSQALYFHFVIHADDDGFVSNPKTIIKMVGANEDDMRVLISKNFALNFNSGIIVLRHFKMMNKINPDRYRETDYQHEKDELEYDIDGSYKRKVEQLEISTM